MKVVTSLASWLLIESFLLRRLEDCLEVGVVEVREVLEGRVESAVLVVFRCGCSCFVGCFSDWVDVQPLNASLK